MTETNVIRDAAIAEAEQQYRRDCAIAVEQYRAVVLPARALCEQQHAAVEAEFTKVFNEAEGRQHRARRSAQLRKDQLIRQAHRQYDAAEKAAAS